MGRRSQKKSMKQLQKTIVVKIRREDPLSKKEFYFETFEVPTEREKTILEILIEIYEKWDDSLAYRHYRCGRRICRSCEVKLDGKIVRACGTLLSPGRRYLLEPAHAEALIRDLVFDFSAIIPE